MTIFTRSSERIFNPVRHTGNITFLRQFQGLPFSVPGSSIQTSFSDHIIEGGEFYFSRKAFCNKYSLEIFEFNEHAKILQDFKKILTE